MKLTIKTREFEMKCRRVLKDLEDKGLVSHVWIIDKKTGDSVLHLAVTDKARELLNGLGRRYDADSKHPV